MISSTGKKRCIRFCLIMAMILLIPMQFTQNVAASDSKSSLGSSMANQNLFKPTACEYDGKIYYAAFSGIYVINSVICSVFLFKW